MGYCSEVLREYDSAKNREEDNAAPTGDMFDKEFFHFFFFSPNRSPESSQSSIPRSKTIRRPAARSE